MSSYNQQLDNSSYGRAEAYDGSVCSPANGHHHGGANSSLNAAYRTIKAHRRTCSVSGCKNGVVQGGVCVSHGAKRRLCRFPGCSKNSKNAGLCSKHGPARKKCEHVGCSNVAVRGGKCKSHGAWSKVCSIHDCSKVAAIGGMCKRHHFIQQNSKDPDQKPEATQNPSPPMPKADAVHPMASLEGGHSVPHDMYAPLSIQSHNSQGAYNTAQSAYPASNSANYPSLSYSALNASLNNASLGASLNNASLSASLNAIQHAQQHSQQGPHHSYSNYPSSMSQMSQSQQMMNYYNGQNGYSGNPSSSYNHYINMGMDDAHSKPTSAALMLGLGQLATQSTGHSSGFFAPHRHGM